MTNFEAEVPDQARDRVSDVRSAAPHLMRGLIAGEAHG